MGKMKSLSVTHWNRHDMCQVTRENQAIFHIIIVGGVFLEKKVIKEGLSYFYTNDADRLILLLNDLINYRRIGLFWDFDMSVSLDLCTLYSMETFTKMKLMIQLSYTFLVIWNPFLAKLISHQMD